MNGIEQRRQPHRGGRRGVAWLLAAAAGALLAGCGGGGEVAVEVPGDCLASWNGESAALAFGRHVYSEHGARQGQMALLEPSRGAVNIHGTEACAMVFAVPESDEEYGDVGMVITSFGWSSMRELARREPSRLREVQREAGLEPNVTLFPDGRVEPL